MQVYHVLFIIGGVFALLGAVFLTFGLIRRRITEGWTPTQGIILKKGRLLPGLPDRYPTFAYRNSYGEAFEHTSSIHQSPGFMPGTTVRVLYDPHDPQRAIIDSFAQRGAVFSLLGGIFLGVGLIIAGVGVVLIYSFGDFPGLPLQ